MKSLRRFIDIEFVLVAGAVTLMVWGIRRLLLWLAAPVFVEIDLVVIGAFSFIWVIQYGQAISKAWKEIQLCEQAIATVSSKVAVLEKQTRCHERLPDARGRAAGYLLALRDFLMSGTSRKSLEEANLKLLEVIWDLRERGKVGSSLSRYEQYHDHATLAQTKLVYQKGLRLPGRTYFFLLSTAILIMSLIGLNASQDATTELIVLAYAFAISSAIMILIDADGPFEEARLGWLRVARIGVDLSILETTAELIWSSGKVV